MVWYRWKGGNSVKTLVRKALDIFDGIILAVHDWMFFTYPNIRDSMWMVHVGPGVVNVATAM